MPLPYVNLLHVSEDTTSRGHYWVLLLCSCGRLFVSSSAKLNTLRSCGCLINTPEYKSWAAAKSRCYRETSFGFEHYGGRGIRMCERWKGSFLEFYKDMGDRPPNTSLERIDVDGDYCPENCRWATPSEQSHNRRTNKLTKNLVEEIRENTPLSQADLARSLGVHQSLISRVLSGQRWKEI